MSRSLQVERIPISDIDFSDRSFSLNPLPDDRVPESLLESISRTGLLRPPILKRKSARALLIISGRKRLAAVRDLHINACNCLIIPPETPEAEIFLIRLEDILSTRPATIIEKALFLKNILPHAGEDEVVQELLPLLGLPRHQRYLKRHLALLEMEEPLIISLHKGLLEEKTALTLSGLSFRDRMALYEIIESLRLGVGKQKKLIAVCRELSTREKTTIAEILAGPEIRQILDHPESNTPQKAANLMAWLSRAQTPLLAEAEKEFRQFTGRLDLPPGASLSHSLSFERDTLTLSLVFKNQEEFLEAWRQIRPVVAKDDR